MTPSEVGQKIGDAFNAGDRETWMAYCSPNLVLNREPGGSEGWAAIFDVLHEAFPDGKGDGARAIEQGEWVATEIVFTGTHTGTLRVPAMADPSGLLADVGPTGKAIELRFAEVSRFVDDKLVEENIYGLVYALQKALGVLPTRAVPRQLDIPT